MCTELQKVRADNKQPLAKIDKLEKEIICLRDIIAEMKHVYTNAQDIFMARLKKMRKYHQRRNASYEVKNNTNFYSYWLISDKFLVIVVLTNINAVKNR